MKYFLIAFLIVLIGFLLMLIYGFIQCFLRYRMPWASKEEEK